MKIGSLQSRDQEEKSLQYVYITGPKEVECSHLTMTVEAMSDMNRALDHIQNLDLI